jgi:tetratricopeptide (TPR) repeat protein
LVAGRQLCQQGTSAIEAGQWERAEQLLAQAVQTCPVDPDSRRHYAEALWHQGQREQAVAQLEEAARLDGDHAALRVRLAEMRLAMGQVEPARRDAQSALDLDPKLAEAWAIRGRIMRACAKPRQALADYHRALGLAPESRSVPLEIAELHRQLNEPQRALAALQSLADKYSPGEEPQRVLYLQGLAYAEMKRWEEAVESFSAALARERPTPEILFQLGRSQLLAGHPAAAAAAAQEALALDPEHQPSRHLLGQVELVLRPDRALRR